MKAKMRGLQGDEKRRGYTTLIDDEKQKQEDEMFNSKKLLFASKSVSFVMSL